MVFYKTFKPKVLFLRKYPNKETEETDHVVLDTLNTDITDKAPDRQEITKFDIFCILFSMITYVADILSDILISLLHYFNNRKLFAILIGIFVIVPSIILNFISFYWWKIDFQQKKKKLQKNEINIIDNSKRCLKINLLLSLFQLGPLSWYYKALKAAINVYKDKDNVLIDKKTKEIKFYKMIEADRDSSLLRFFEAILESLPQTLVQGYFILDQVVNKDFEMSFLIMMQILSIILSLISACTSLTIQHRALRISRDDKNNMLIMESIFQGLWRFLTLLSRYIVIILYAYYLQKWFWILIIIHLALSASHIFSLQSLETGDNSRYIDFILLVINTMIHIFLPFNMAEGSTLWRYIIGYLIEFVEYLGLIIIIFSNPLNKPLPYIECFIVTPFFLFILGIFCMLLYYCSFHPSKSKNQNLKTSNEIEMNDNHHEEGVINDTLHIEIKYYNKMEENKIDGKNIQQYDNIPEIESLLQPSL